MSNCLFYTAGEVQDMLGVSRGKAYKLVKDLNEELRAMGYIVVAGKIPKKYFNDHYYGLSEYPQPVGQRTSA